MSGSDKENIDPPVDNESSLFDTPPASDGEGEGGSDASEHSDGSDDENEDCAGEDQNEICDECGWPIVPGYRGENRPNMCSECDEEVGEYL